MKGGKGEEKRLDPLFPRLHINDTDKGGPRAPPRNKMAISEQPAITISPGTMPTLSLSSANVGNSISPASSSLVGCNKKSLFSPFCNLSGSSNYVELLHPYASGTMNFTLRHPDVWPMKPLNHQTLCLKEHFPSTSQRNPFQPHSLSYANSNPSANKFGRENDFCGTKFVPPGKPLNYGNRPQIMEKEKIAISLSNPSLKFKGTHEKQLKETGSAQLKLREHINQAGDLAQSLTREHCAKKPAPVLSARDESLVDGSSSQVHTELDIRSFVSSAQENRCGLVGDLNRPSDSNSESDEDCWNLHERKATEDVTYAKHEEATTKRCASINEGLSCDGDNHRTPKRVKSSLDCPKGQIEVGDADRSERISEAPALNSMLVDKVSPDNVIGLIGQRFFWKARRTIVHQQRIFAIQLFELHRVIKVQKLIAGSAETLFEDNFYLHQLSIRFASAKKLPSDDVQEPPALAQKADSKKPNSIECPADNAYEKLLPLCNDNEKRLILQKPTQKAYVAGTSTLRSVVTDPKLAPQSFQPPSGNHWLVPIRSPSEGLVYKPYTGPCPPPAGFMAPVYGSCRPVILSAIGGEFSNVPYSVPTSHHQDIGIFPAPVSLGQTYFEPYSMPVINPSGSSSSVEQMKPFSRIRSSEKENSPYMHDINLVRPRKRSFNIESQKSLVISADRTIQAERGGDMQGSPASSPSERVQRDALSLFPITPTAKVSHQPAQNENTEQRIQVIKVVPHNPKSASESAARIFRSIQEERKLHF